MASSISTTIVLCLMMGMPPVAQGELSGDNPANGTARDCPTGLTKREPVQFDFEGQRGVVSLAAIAAMAKNDPESIVNLFTDNGDGTVEISFFTEEGQPATTIEVFVGLDWGIEQANLSGDTDDRGYIEIWPQLLEAAYREFLNQTDPDNDFEGGNASDVWEDILVDDHESIPPGSKSDEQIAELIETELEDTGRVVVGTYDSVDGKGPIASGELLGWHEYLVIKYDRNGTPNDFSDDLITLFNPHGYSDDPIQVTLEQFKEYIESIYVPEQDP